MPRMVLLDAYQKGAYGGTGKTADWSLAAEYLKKPGYPSLVLAGGLTSENVAHAIESVHPAAVDTAGGVESRPGQKDMERTQAFLKNARATFEKLSCE